MIEGTYVVLGVVHLLSVGDLIATGYPIIDVRSPAEFNRGHVPGALSLPLFSDTERAVVGTLYKKDGRDRAVIEGLRIVGPRLAATLEEARSIAPDGRVAVHCWRGGERSGSMAWLLDKAGFKEVMVLKGGYKAFRNHVLASFQELPELLVLGGRTGSGKTGILRQLRAMGEQVIDLESLANHKGSAFGALGEAPQPTQEHFENLLWDAFRSVDRARPVWLEDESRRIGRLELPAELYNALRNAHLYFAEVPKDERVRRLVEDYGRFPKDQLAAAIERITKRLGPQHARVALDVLEQGDLHTVARIVLVYYDKTYDHGLSKRDPSRVSNLPALAGDAPSLATRLKEHATTSTASD